MTSIDESLFTLLKSEILSRARDKEPLVRKEIVSAMSILQTAEGDEDTDSIWHTLAELLQYDPSPIVRRSALASVPLNPQTLPSIISRCSDVDSMTRKVAYKVIAEHYATFDDLSSSFCISILNYGLKDNDPSVQEACLELIDKWISDSPLDLIRLLVKLNVVASLSVSETLVLVTLKRHPKFVEKVYIDDDFWKNLTPETALLLRCMGQTIPSVAEEMVVETLAYYLQSHTNRMLLNQDEKMDQAFEYIVHELLKLASSMDYADELGRRQMFSLIRSMVTSVDISEELMDPLMGLFRMICIDERDFIRVIQDVVRDIQDEAMEDDEADAQIFRDLKCLLIIQKTLASSSMGWRHESFAPMHGLLPELILPAFQRHSEYGIIVASAVACLGLICLSSKEHAQQYLSQIIAYAGAPCAMNLDLVDVVLSSSKVLFDLIYVYGMESLNAPVERIYNTFLNGLSCPVRSVASLYIEGCVKLFLVRRISDLEELKTLLVMALSPEQYHANCLNYFLEAFPKAHPDNVGLLEKVYAKVIASIAESNPTQLVSVSQKMSSWLDNAKPGLWQAPVAVELIQTGQETEVFKHYLQVCLKFNFAHAELDQIMELRSWVGQVHSQDPSVQNALKKIDKQLVSVAPALKGTSTSPNLCRRSQRLSSTRVKNRAFVSISRRASVLSSSKSTIS
ncbi:hypothetical protein HMI55_005731 [Coelomomyces lativittatus]|nr:hypothetical protein HMI55_005731 [Coelomomyces lativittatus]